MASQKTVEPHSAVTITSLKQRGDFLRLRKSRTYKCKVFAVSAGKNQTLQGQTRIGFTVTTKMGNAVVRNRIKRRLRAVAAAILPEKGLRGFDYVVIARRATLRAEYAELISEFSSALDHVQKNGSKD